MKLRRMRRTGNLEQQVAGTGFRPGIALRKLRATSINETVEPK
jgi:hypothetical protein